MQLISELIPYIEPWVPGAPENMIMLELHEALRQFCMDTEVWTEDVTMNQVADQASYSISLTSEATIQRIVNVMVKTTTSQNYDDLKNTPYPVDWYYLSNGAVVFYNNKEPQHTITNGIRFTFALRPTPLTEELSDDLLDRYAEGIYMLTRANMMMVPKKPYYDPNLAERFMDTYRNVRMMAIREKTVGFKDQGLQVVQLGGIL